MDLGVVSWCGISFYEQYHGKGPCDRVFGAIQQAMRQKGFVGMDQLLSFIETVTCDVKTKRKCQVAPKLYTTKPRTLDPKP